MLYFIDTSLYDGIVDWKNYTWDGAFIKASEGLAEDPKFKAQWQAAKGYTIRGAYHFFRPFVDPIQAAEKFVGYMGTDKGELPGVLDLETTDGYASGVPEKALKWMGRYRVLTGVLPIIYTSPGFANAIHLYNYRDFADYPLWMAEYPWDKIEGTWTEQKRRDKIYNILKNPSTFPFPTPPHPFTSVTWVQWTGKCPPEYVPGYPLGTKLAVDVSFCRMTMKELFDKFNIIFVPKGNIVTDTTVTITGELKSGEVSNLRPQAGLSGGIIRMLTGPLHVQGFGQKVLKDNYYWSEVNIVETSERGWIAWTTAYENVVVTPTTNTKPSLAIHIEGDGYEPLDVVLKPKQ